MQVALFMGALTLLSVAAAQVAFLAEHFLARYVALEIVALCVALAPLAGDAAFRDTWLGIKRLNARVLAQILEGRIGADIDAKRSTTAYQHLPALLVDPSNDRIEHANPAAARALEQGLGPRHHLHRWRR